MRTIKALLVLTALAIAAALGFIYTGAVDVAADSPHSKAVSWLLGTARNRSVYAHARDIRVPALDDSTLIAAGAQHYAAMCVGCHLAPGLANTEIRQGLYPKPPKLAEPVHGSAAEQFWIIKHGVKLTAMPAWGVTHDDQSIWGLVAFLRKLPEMSPEQYQQMTAGSPAHGHHPGEHEHGHADDGNEG